MLGSIGFTLISEHLRRSDSDSSLCERYGISRKTGYKWITPMKASAERSWRRGARRARNWIQQRLAERFGEGEVPSRTTSYNILKAAGRVAD
ncbi:conserved protein of unknown function (plasmid) [Cupriavidus taiwanensis]|uniref:Uncharacterized protein n=1 Tax=Cupriavidus taiwanensis TaxID=164546 RepID=A0A375FIA1_9BURK|nr:hypothetical protein [Cupriavidus taiwanensis]SOZ70896.1 conserved protein of unknown function [Cupriavidus taiwanensis]SOZ72075.1 conserved protein of unknown function [Cupriavidus taiwanensis]SOZ74386.1 conserved protein of unknown function [Cupriavidus taiwanensis]SPA03294.1 conserved protein of unknown function [Cupriavidus taiwanensis]SPA11268.1 conserved protein of unknown function [Cupriavidus taiwanensis]